MILNFAFFIIQSFCWFLFRDGFPEERISAILHQMELSQKHQHGQFGLGVTFVSCFLFFFTLKTIYIINILILLTIIRKYSFYKVKLLKSIKLRIKPSNNNVTSMLCTGYHAYLATRSGPGSEFGVFDVHQSSETKLERWFGILAKEVSRILCGKSMHRRFRIFLRHKWKTLFRQNCFTCLVGYVSYGRFFCQPDNDIFGFSAITFFLDRFS